ncbi:MAG: hypothetical protein JXB26_08180 [Candidatus Aminicenantes bacterium]|nr:hypothetical protein [Candidatus Aminicenantes bacterium]
MNSSSGLILILFYSHKNCQECLEIIDVLNKIRDSFQIVGIVPDGELDNPFENETEFLPLFPVIGLKKYRKYLPPYTPAVLGVSGEGTVFFKIPITAYSAKTFKHYLLEFHSKIMFYLASR